MKVNYFRTIDNLIGNLLIILLSPLVLLEKCFVKKPVNPEKILIFRLWSLGESILALPMIDELKKLYPEAKIDVMVSWNNKGIFKYDKNVDEELVFEPKNFLNIISKFKSYDLVLDPMPYFKFSSLLSFWMGKYSIGFSHSIRSLAYSEKVKFGKDKHIVKTFCDFLKPLGFGSSYPEKLVKLSYPDSVKQRVDSFLNDYYEKKNIGIHIGTGETGPQRAWPIERFAEVAKQIIDKEEETVIFVSGGKKESELNQKLINLVNNSRIINLSGKFNLHEFFYLMEKLEVFITNDTGPLHVAAAQGSKVIGIFGPETPVRFGPYGEGHVALYKPSKQSPCISVWKGYAGQNCKCVGGCVRNITVEEVLNSYFMD